MLFQFSFGGEPEPTAGKHLPLSALLPSQPLPFAIAFDMAFAEPSNRPAPSPA
jgi:hypothetical protein